MPQPTRTDLHVDAPLTDLSVAYLQSQDAFIATKAFPIIQVDKQSNKYFKYDKDAWFRDDAKQRKSSEESAGSGYPLSTDSYSCDLFAFHKDIDDFDRLNADPAVANMDRDATEFVSRILLLRQEAQWVSDAFATSVWGTDKVGGTDFVVWSDKTGSDPREDVDAGKEKVLSNTGFEPNTLILGYQTYRQLRRHPDVIDQNKYTNPDSINAAMLAGFFDIDNILVAKAVKNTAKEGQTFVGGFTHGKHALLAYVNPNPGPLQPSAGYTFAWSGPAGNLRQVSIMNIRMPHLRSDRIEGVSAFDNKITGSDLGYFFSGAVS